MILLGYVGDEPCKFSLLKLWLRLIDGLLCGGLHLDSGLYLGFLFCYSFSASCASRAEDSTNLSINTSIFSLRESARIFIRGPLYIWTNRAFASVFLPIVSGVISNLSDLFICQTNHNKTVVNYFTQYYTTIKVVLST